MKERFIYVLDNGEDTIYDLESKDILCRNEIADMLNELLMERDELELFKNNVCKLLDAKIQVYNHEPFSAPVSNPVSVKYDSEMDRLARLTELSQLKEEIRRIMVDSI